MVHISHRDIGTMTAKPRSNCPPIVIVGPTAVGKTEVAYHLALALDGEIVNADSMQVYIGMDIGTAKPSIEMRKYVRFHMLDVVYPDQSFNAFSWKEQTEAILEDITYRGKVPIICGGTGLYIRSLLEGWALANAPSDPAIRARLYEEAQSQGNECLHGRLSLIDPTAAQRLHPNDQVRVIRALEVYETTGQTISSFQIRDKQQVQHRKTYRYGLCAERSRLIERINGRVDRMISSGFEHEVRQLLDANYSPSLSPMRSLGYKEMISFLAGSSDFRSAIEEIKKSTQQYSKRQMTWFRADTQVQWIDATDITPISIASNLIQKMECDHNARNLSSSDTSM